MRLRFGTNSAGGVDTRAAALMMAVSQRTVQRWLRGPHPRSLAHIPPRRLEQLIALLLPMEVTREREAQQARYASQAILTAGQRGKLISPAWKKQRWLEPHVVVVLEVKIDQLRIRQLAVARDEPSKVREIHRRGRVVDQVLVPTRFHATMLSHQVLTTLAPWRFQAGRSQVAQGFTQAWLGDAPRTNLAGALDEVLEDLKSKKQAAAKAERGRRKKARETVA